ncbi:hypothetical protein [Micromonospora sp. NPDC023814]
MSGTPRQVDQALAEHVREQAGNVSVAQPVAGTTSWQGQNLH